MPRSIRTEKHFDGLAQQYDRLTDWTSHPDLLNDVISCVTEGPIVDVGAGPGTLAYHLGGRLPVGTSITSIDCSLNMCRCAMRRGVRALHGVAESLPIRTATVRTIVCRQALQYLDQETALTEWQRVLRAGGIAVISQSVSDDIASTLWWQSVKAVVQPLRRSWWSRAELRDLLGRYGFHVQACKARWILNRRPLSQFLINATVSPADSAALLQEWVSSSPASVGFSLTKDLVIFRQLWVTYKAILS